MKLLPNFLLVFLLLFSSQAFAGESLTGIVLNSRIKENSYVYHNNIQSYKRECVYDAKVDGKKVKEICFKKPVQKKEAIRVDNNTYVFSLLADRQIYKLTYKPFWTVIYKPLFARGESVSFSFDKKKNKVKILLDDEKKIKARIIKIEAASDDLIEKANHFAKNYTDNF